MTFAQYLIKHKITDVQRIRNLLLNKEITVLSRASGHKLQTGAIITNVSQLTIYQVGTGYDKTYVGLLQNPIGGGGSIYLSDFSISVDETKSDFETRLKDLESEYQAERNELEKKINLMDEYELDVYDEEVVRINLALDTLESTKSRKAKVKALKELIK